MKSKYTQQILQPTVVLAFATSILLSASVRAQQRPNASANPPAPAEETVRLDPYTISATSLVGWNSQMTFSGSRTAQELLEVPINISILTSEFLKDIGATDALGFLRYAASGVTQRVNYRDDYTFRGFRQQKSRDGLSGGGAGFNGGFTPLFDVERVEVIKGPTALVFSNFGNVSGTLNFVTKRPTSKPMGDLSVTVGNFDTYIAEATQRGPLTHDGSVRYRVTIGAQEYGGWHGEDTDANSYFNHRLASASVDWTASQKLEFRFDVSHKYQRNRDYQESLIDPTTNRVWTRSVDGYTTSTDWSYQRTVEQRVRAEAIYTMTPDLTLRVLSNLYGSAYDFSTIWAGTGLVASEAPNFATIRGMVNHAYDREDTLTDSLADLTWSLNTGSLKNRLNAGWQYNQIDNSRVEPITALPNLNIDSPISSRPTEPLPSARANSARVTSRNGGWTGYVQDSVTLMEGRMIGSAGLRYVSASATTLAKKTTVPSYGLLYRFLPKASIYASYAESYTPRVGFDVFGKPLRDTIGRSTEAGLKVNAFKEQLFGTLTYFDILNDPVFRQVQGVHPVTGLPLLGNAQVGKETNKGWEMDIGWVQQVGPGAWSIYTTGYFADPKTATGLQPNSAIKRKYSAFSKYAVGRGSLKGMILGGGASHTGGSPGTGFPWMPSYTFFSALVGYQWQSWKAMLNVENVADKRDAIVGSEGNTFAYLAAPRSIRLTLSRTW